MVRIVNYNRPKNTRRALVQMLSYFGRHKQYVLIIALLVTISTSASTSGTHPLEPVINDYIIPGDIPGLMKMLTLMGLLYPCGALICLAYNWIMIHTFQQAVSEIRVDLSRYAQRLSLTYFDAHIHGEPMSRFTNDVDIVSEALDSSLAMMIQNFITIIDTLTILLVLNWRSPLTVMVFLTPMFLSIRYSGKRSKKYFVQQQRYLGSTNGFAEKMVTGQKVEKALNHGAQSYKEFCRRNEAFRTAATKALTCSGMTVPTIMVLSYVNYALSTCVGGLFTLAGLTDLGTLAFYLVYVRQSPMPINQFTQQISFLLAALSGAEHIFDMINEEQETDGGTVTLCDACRDDDGTLKEYSKSIQEYAWKEQGGGHLIPLRRDVRFSDMTFRYTREKVILNGVSPYIKPGQRVVFMGPTGVGKTTITNPMNCFYKLDSGAIAHDDIDIQDIKKDGLRRSPSMVIQDTHLFTGTIADNIRHGYLDTTREDVISAAKVANVYSLIRRLPQGYDTALHSGDSSLSRDQRQLLAIARAAIFLPPALVLDGITNPIGTRAEKLTEKGTDASMGGRTVLAITHRLSTVRESKAISALEKDEVIERGSHGEPLEEKGKYYQLYAGQFELEQEKWGVPKGIDKQIRLKQPAAPTWVRPDPWRESLNYD